MTIGGTTAPAYAFLFGPESADTQTTKALERVRAVLNRNPLGILSSLVDALKAQEKGLIRAAPAGADLTTRSLDDPTQWSMGWTTFPDARTLGLPHLNEWAATLDVTQPDKATEAFFPTIARYGRSYNLILTRKVKSPRRGRVACALRQRLDTRAGRSGRSRPALRDRSADLRNAEGAAGRRLFPVHTEHGHGAGAGCGDESVDSRTRSRRRR